MNLHYKVESAFEEMKSALKLAIENCSEDEAEIYSDLADELIGARDNAHKALVDLLVKKNTAPAAGTTEAVKNDSYTESKFSLNENSDDVKRSSMTLTVLDDDTAEASLKICGPNRHLLMLYAAAVETIVFTAPDLLLSVEDLEKARLSGMERAMERLREKARQRLSQISESKRDKLLRLAKDFNLPEDFMDSLFGGAR